MMRQQLTPANCILLGFLLICAACQPGVPWPSTAPAWQDAIPVAHATSIEPPAIGIRNGNGWLVAWADATSIQTLALSTTGTTAPPQTIYSGQSPWEPVLIPAADGEWHLLWRDVDTYATPHLFSALLSTEGELLRGPIKMPSDGISAFAAAPGDGGTTVLIWADLAPRPTLHGHQIDAQGRPSAAPPMVIARNAENPALTRGADGTWYTTWLAWPASAVDDSASRIVTVATSQRTLPWQSPQIHELDLYVQPTLTTYVESLTIGLDHTTGYVFLSLRNASTQDALTRMVTFALDADLSVADVSEVQLPNEGPVATPTVQTGFNTGPAWTIQDSDAMSPAAWPVPAPGQHATLPVGFVIEDEIGIGYFQGGHLIGYQPVIAEARPLTGSKLEIDRDRYLTLAWSGFPSNQDEPAPQLLTSTRPLLENPQN